MVMNNRIKLVILFFLILIALPSAGLAQTPNLTALSFTPTSINTGGGPATVTVNFTSTDNVSSIFYFETAFVDPTNVFTHRAFKFLSPPRSPATDSVAITFPQFSPPGTWNLAYVFIVDSAGNSLFLNTNG